MLAAPMVPIGTIAPEFIVDYRSVTFLTRKFLAPLAFNAGGIEPPSFKVALKAAAS
jgi:hypothetical protein